MPTRAFPSRAAVSDKGWLQEIEPDSTIGSPLLGQAGIRISRRSFWRLLQQGLKLRNLLTSAL